MRHNSTFIFLILASTFSLIWGCTLWFFAEKQPFIKSLCFRLMSYSRMTFEQFKSTVLALIYYLSGGLVCCLFIMIYRLDFLIYLKFSLKIGFVTMLGIVATLTLTNLLTQIFWLFIPSHINIQEQIKNVPWIEGILKLPKGLKVFSPGIAAIVEEFFFRGTIFLIMTTILSINTWIAICITAILFIFQQSIQTRTFYQAAAIGIGSLAISITGCLLILATGSIISSIICHLAFLFFFFRY